MNIWKIVIGVLFILGGGIFILANMGVIPADASLLLNTYWPSLIILASVVMLIDALMKTLKPKRRFNHIYFAFCVFVTGFVLQNDKLALIPVKGVDLWEVIVALVLVYIGIKLIFFKSGIGHGVKITVDTDDDNVKHAKFETGAKDIGCDDNGDNGDNDDYDNDDSEAHSEDHSERKNRDPGKDGKRKGVFISTGGDHEQFIGDLRLGDMSWAPEGGSYTVNVGDIHVDFTTAIFNEGETKIDLSCWVGDISVVVPDDLPIDLYAEANVGEVVFTGHTEKSGISNNTVKYRSEGYDEAVKKLKLKASLNIGSIKVSRV